MYSYGRTIVEHEPWEWREVIARSGKVAYGKFFNKKAGFVSMKWLPYFVNFRRDGYDFVTSAYGEESRDSAKRIYEYIREQYLVATNQQIRKVLGITLDKI